MRSRSDRKHVLEEARAGSGAVMENREMSLTFIEEGSQMGFKIGRASCRERV